MVTFAALSDAGLVRNNNEDCHHCDPENGIAIVADGVGGYEYGEVASELAAVSSYDYLMREPDLDDVKSLEAALLESIRYANQKIMEYKGGHPQYKDMGTTLTCAHVAGNELRYAWAGDSRLYLYNVQREELRQLTTDHTLYEELRRRGEHPGRHTRSVLTRMLGSSGQVRPDSGCILLEEGDRALICTDGLTDLVSEIRLLETLVEHADDTDACLQALVALANNEGGRDNTTAVLVQPG